MSIKSFLSIYFARFIVQKNLAWKNNAVKAQENLLKNLLKTAKNTKFGFDHNFAEIKNYDDFKKNVPIRDYEDLSSYIENIKKGEVNILWPGKPIYFCKTSGTTSGTKYIPITKESMPCHLNSARDAILSYIVETKNTSILNGKMIFWSGLLKCCRCSTGAWRSTWTSSIRSRTQVSHFAVKAAYKLKNFIRL